MYWFYSSWRKEYMCRSEFARDNYIFISYFSLKKKKKMKILQKLWLALEKFRKYICKFMQIFERNKN